jgi:dTDP-4-dehydrorhamnose reductase
MSKPLHIAVLGAGGQLGQEFMYLQDSLPGFKTDFFTSSELDISEASTLKKYLSEKNYDYVINCAAYTAVDKAESEPEKCWLVNASACQYICDSLKNTQTRLIHFSTDYVYDNGATVPMEEESPTLPRSVYGKSKLRGEHIIRESKIPAMIIRTSWVISSYGHNFLKTMIRLGKEKKDIRVVSDQKGAPTYARHLAKAVIEIIMKTEKGFHSLQDFSQTYNFANSGDTTWYEMALKIMKKTAAHCEVHPIPTIEYPTPAQRPSYSVMSLDKIRRTYGLEITPWEKALEECLAELGY